MERFPVSIPAQLQSGILRHRLDEADVELALSSHSKSFEPIVQMSAFGRDGIIFTNRMIAESNALRNTYYINFHI